MAQYDAPIVVCRHWAEGGKGAEELARTVVDMVDNVPVDFHFVYEDS
ncbi:MAG: formate--tetrahydrofolate ligase, partial [Beijerinckiaceae bacterium]|nr:formate--tetrahydrofolate ligase [Beijerinckiaceae bacterium]